MSLTTNDLQSIKGIVQESETRLESKLTKKIRSSEGRLEKRLKEFVMNELSTQIESQLSSHFKIQKIVLDTQFRAIDSRFDNLEKRMEAGFERVGKHLYEHGIEIETLKERVGDIEERMPLHS